MKTLHVLKGHETTIYGSAFDPSGAVAATACVNGRVILWDVATGARVRTMEAGARVNALAFGADGVYLFASGSTGVHVWVVETGEKQPDLPGARGSVYDLDLRADGGLLAAASDDGTVRTWRLPEREYVRDFTTPGDKAVAVALHPTRALLAVGTQGGRVLVWSTESGKLVQRLTAHEGAVMDLTFDPRGGALVTAGSDRLARIWLLRSP